jgi:preprotein translocase subunit SecB
VQDVGRQSDSAASKRCAGHCHSQQILAAFARRAVKTSSRNAGFRICFLVEIAFNSLNN